MCMRNTQYVRECVCSRRRLGRREREERRREQKKNNEDKSSQTPYVLGLEGVSTLGVEALRPAKRICMRARGETGTAVVAGVWGRAGEGGVVGGGRGRLRRVKTSPCERRNAMCGDRT